MSHEYTRMAKEQPRKRSSSKNDGDVLDPPKKPKRTRRKKPAKADNGEWEWDGKCLKPGDLEPSDPRASSIRPSEAERIYGHTPGTGFCEQTDSATLTVPHLRLDSAKAPLSNINDIFTHLTKKAHTTIGLQIALSRFLNDPLRIVTMCSGTESPVLALRLIQQSLERDGHESFEFEHLASAEIEPFKQAYIQRNFDPPVIFRDVREFNKLPAHPPTVYNTTAPPPESVHILIAGSSCVDYSTLNNDRKDFGMPGESLATMDGIRAYANKFRPNVIILENVKSAPWEKIQAFWNKIEYYTQVVQIDTKNFYIPQTRQRGYMLAMDIKLAKRLGFDLAAAAKVWLKSMHQLQQRASAPFTDFIFDDDDPCLEQLRCGEPTAREIGLNARSQNWTACRHRYSGFRLTHSLGSSRPLTRWKNNGSCVFPDSGWKRWARDQRERIWDTLDIDHLSYVAQRDYDMNHKHRWIELSQNVDRDMDRRPWGTIGCLTPSGMPYLTTRQGPVTGREVLALQGLPLVELNLTRETSRQLQDLAGNAMTTTVVAAAIISALVAAEYTVVNEGKENVSLSFFEEFKGETEKRKTQEKTSKVAATITSILQNCNALPLKNTPVQLGSTPDHTFRDVLSLAKQTLQLCKCEGFAAIAQAPVQYCTMCGHSACTDCGGNPDHKYEPFPTKLWGGRQAPIRFLTAITGALPMSLSLTGITVEASPLSHEMLATDLERQAYERSRRAALKTTVFFHGVKRGKAWKILYESETATLELQFSRNTDSVLGSLEIRWLLFAKPDKKLSTVNGARRLLKRPIARMMPSTSLLDGLWQVWIPGNSKTTSLVVSGHGETIPSWEQRLGLQVEPFASQRVFTRLSIELQQPCATKTLTALQEVCGTYELLPFCGTAGGSLHRRVRTDWPGRNDTFLYLDPEPLQDSRFDRFVFAATHGRLSNGECRPVIAELEEGWRPDEHQVNKANVNCLLIETWNDCSEARLFSANNHKTSWTPAQLRDLTDGTGDWLQVRSLVDGKIDCKQSVHTVLVAEIPLMATQQKTWKANRRYPVKLLTQPTALQEFSWFLMRAGQIDGRDEWHKVDKAAVPDSQCSSCAPKIPALEWQKVEKRRAGPNSRKIVKPFETLRDAMEYEKAMRNRPSPVIATMHCQGPQALLQVELNVVTLVHQLSGKMAAASAVLCRQTSASWRLSNCADVGGIVVLSSLSIPSNAKDKSWVKPQTAQEGKHNKDSKNPFLPNVKRSLWPAQRKTLSWMLGQEFNPPGWEEKEREEVDIPSLGWRLEVEVRLPRTVRGGVLADEVGAGKTTTSLALVAASKNHLKKHLNILAPVKSRHISSKATLFLVPKNLVAQWEKEIRICMPGCEVVMIKFESQLKNTSIKAIREADIVLAAWDLFDETRYWETVEDICGAEQLPLTCGRAFQQWLSEAVSDLGDLVAASSLCDDISAFWNERDTKKQKASKYGVFKAAASRKEPSDAQKAAAKKAAASRAAKHAAAGTVPQSSKPSASETKETIPPVLQLFGFERLVVDEFTYLRGCSLAAVLQLQASSRWMLSGTPPLADFDSVNTMAKLIGTRITAEDEKHGLFSLVKGGEKMAVKTYAEEFHAYETTRSADWVAARNRQAASFVEAFVRQNPADLTKIGRLDHYHIVKMTAMEQALYFEVYQIVMSQNLKLGRNFDVENLMKMDRGQRLNAAIVRSISREDALLSCFSDMRVKYLTGNATTTAEAKSEEDPALTGDPTPTEDPAPTGTEPGDGKKKKRKITFEPIPEGPPKSAEDMCSEVIDGKEEDYETTRAELYTALQEAYGYTNLEPNETVEQNPHLNYFTENITKHRMGDQDTTTAIAMEMECAKKEPVAPTKRLAKVKLASSVTDDGEEPEEEAVDLSSVQGPGGQKKKTKKQIAEANLEKKKADERKVEMAHRAAALNALAERLVDHARGIRLFESFREVIGNERLGECSHCLKPTPKNLNRVYIMGICGHIACKKCFEDDKRKEADPDGCPSEGCGASALAHHLILASRFTKAETSPASWEGSKMSTVLDQIKEIPDDERIIIFVQSGRVKLHLLDCLMKAEKDKTIIARCTANGILKARDQKREDIKAKAKAEESKEDRNSEDEGESDPGEHQEFGGDNHRQTTSLAMRPTVFTGSKSGVLDATKHSERMVNKFIHDEGTARICVLQIDSANAAGWNLHMANHVFFIAPLLTGTQYQYESIMTQAVGRARRFKQKKTVHVYHFLMSHSIEVNIVEKREHKNIVKRGNTFKLVKKALDTDEVGWRGPSLDGAMEYEHVDEDGVVEDSDVEEEGTGDQED